MEEIGWAAVISQSMKHVVASLDKGDTLFRHGHAFVLKMPEGLWDSAAC